MSVLPKVFMFRIKRLCLALLLIVSASIAFAEDQKNPQSLLDAIKMGDSLSSIRFRYEGANEDGLKEGANALTARVLLGWQTASYNGLRAGIQLGHVESFVDDYNDFKDGKTSSAKAGYPKVIDPQSTEINQLYVDWLTFASIRMGRQSYKLDNSRFIGNLEFRQNMQVFDGVSAQKNFFDEQLQTNVAYFSGARQPTTHYEDLDVRLLNLKYSINKTHKLTLYGYWLDFNNDVSKSSQTLGFLFQGEKPFFDDLVLTYQAEAATQDEKSNSLPGTPSYYRYSAGVKDNSWSIRYEHENLGATSQLTAFQAPLGMYRLFQGWSDRFTSTPKYGIDEDRIVGTATWKDIQFEVQYHLLGSDQAFVSTEGNQEKTYGHEFDVGVKYIAKSYDVGMQYANFVETNKVAAIAENGRKPDLSRLWLWVTAPF